MSKRRILFAFAHPDDESFGSGALISRYVAEGADTYLICTTDGGVGTVSEEYLNGYNSISELRLAELACAADKLGFKKVFQFDYKDSGMMGSATAEDPDSSWQQWQTHPEEFTRRVVEVIREVRPQVIVTFNRYGGYGHPDHIAIQRATTEAFQLAGSPDYITDGQQPYQPQKLYYTTIPTAMIRIGIWWMRIRGKDPRKLGRNADIDMIEILNNVEPTHTKINISDYLDAWDEASACHVSQGGGQGGIIPRWLRTVISPQQGLTRVYPAPSRDKVDEYDLFTGVALEDAEEVTA